MRKKWLREFRHARTGWLPFTGYALFMLLVIGMIQREMQQEIFGALFILHGVMLNIGVLQSLRGNDPPATRNSSQTPPC